MARGGHNKAKDDAATRKCIVTGEAQPKAGLVRFVVGPDDQVYPDVLGKLPGRGMYVSSTREALDAANKGQFSRSAKQAVTVPDGLTAEVERQISRHAVDLIAMTRKSGRAVCGFEKVKGWLAGGERVRVLVQASNGSERGKAKLWTPEGARYFGCFTAEELGLAFGRQSVIHGALATGGLSNRVVEEATRLRGLREVDGGDTASGKDIEAK
ncbi:RNA-binding protein [Loktanella sp. D2R18]|uniref:RNA-binding protein n=1 Tax=Rhodobacterales TaxID=204455 RepID=UPI000DEB6B38|nr:MULTISPECIES: RNA-binding protein [Rhodobacterales]MDO6590412.1 RNA-binding protein [Yoonia sp. 1_MG-2023]RBW41138.1 RNA-binding protein [Loktanella sp. D2R18]